MPYVYILRCADGSYYTGSTTDLWKRLGQHEDGAGANHTARHQAVELVYLEKYNRIEDAFRREKQIQGWTRAKKELLIAGRKNELPLMAKKIFHCEQ